LVKTKSFQIGCKVDHRGKNKLLIVVETVSSKIIQMITGKDRDMSRLGHIVAEAHTVFVSTHFIGISKNPRSDNVTSDELVNF